MTSGTLHIVHCLIDHQMGASQSQNGGVGSDGCFNGCGMESVCSTRSTEKTVTVNAHKVRGINGETSKARGGGEGAPQKRADGEEETPKARPESQHHHHQQQPNQQHEQQGYSSCKSPSLFPPRLDKCDGSFEMSSGRAVSCGDAGHLGRFLAQ